MGGFYESYMKVMYYIEPSVVLHGSELEKISLKTNFLVRYFMLLMDACIGNVKMHSIS